MWGLRISVGLEERGRGRKGEEPLGVFKVI